MTDPLDEYLAAAGIPVDTPERVVAHRDSHALVTRQPRVLEFTEEFLRYAVHANEAVEAARAAGHVVRIRRPDGTSEPYPPRPEDE